MSVRKEKTTMITECPKMQVFSLLFLNEYFSRPKRIGNWSVPGILCQIWRSKLLEYLTTWYSCVLENTKRSIAWGSKFSINYWLVFQLTFRSSIFCLSLPSHFQIQRLFEIIQPVIGAFRSSLHLDSQRFSYASTRESTSLFEWKAKCLVGQEGKQRAPKPRVAHSEQGFSSQLG